MARFVKITTAQGGPRLINTDFIVQAHYLEQCTPGPEHGVNIEVVKGGASIWYCIDFEHKHEAIEFLEKNFLIFNS